MTHVVKINRAPVLTLWAAVVAECLGFDWDEALTLGRAVAGLNAYSKGGVAAKENPARGACAERDRVWRTSREVSMRHLAISVAGLAVVASLGACAVPPENDPHNLPYIVWPSDSPDVYQYSTNPYPALTAPPLYAPGGGRD